MKYSFRPLVLMAVVGLATAQDGIPDCAKQFIDKAAADAGCGVSDIACACEPANQAKIFSEAAPFVEKACGDDVAIQQVLPAAKALCASVVGASSSSLSSGLSALSSVTGTALSSSASKPSTPSADITPTSTGSSDTTQSSESTEPNISYTSLSAQSIYCTATTPLSTPSTPTTTATAADNSTDSIVPFTGNAASLEARCTIFSAVGLAVLAAFWVWG